MVGNLKLTGALLALISVVLGAFAAHALKNYLSPEEVASFQTGTRYLMYHALALLVLSNFDKEKYKLSVQLIFYGVLLFSFSIFGIYALKLMALPYSWLGPVTPIGGLLLIIGWGSVAVKSFNNRKNEHN